VESGRPGWGAGNVISWALRLSLQELVKYEPAEGRGAEVSVTTGQPVGEALRGGSLLKAGNGSCFLSPKPYFKTIAPPPQGFPGPPHPALEPPS